MLTYTREDIIRRSSDKLGCSYSEVKITLESILDTMALMLIEEHSNIRIELRNFGVFEVKPTKPKARARNPKTNEEFHIPSRKKVRFKAGKMIKDVIKQEWKV